MSAADEPMPLAQQLKALRQIQFVLGQKERPLALSCGITQPEFATLANGELIEVTFFRDEGPELERFHIEKILPKGYALLAQAHVLDAPLKVEVGSPQRSKWQHISHWSGKILWEILKPLLAALGGFVAGWFAAKYHLKQ